MEKMTTVINTKIGETIKRIYKNRRKICINKLIVLFQKNGVLIREGPSQYSILLKKNN